jgi:hypothetical protein
LKALSPGVEEGAVYQFHAVTGALDRTFANPDPHQDQDDRFGGSIAVAGNRLLIGAPLAGTPGLLSGAAYLFDLETGALLQTFLNPTPANVDMFGYALALIGSLAVIGAPRDDDAAGEDDGAIYIYEASTGELLQTVGDPLPAQLWGFGKSVANADGDIAATATGTPPDPNGAAFIIDVPTATVLQTLLIPEGESGVEEFGYTVVAFGRNLAVSAPSGTSGGAVYVFQKPALVPGIGTQPWSAPLLVTALAVWGAASIRMRATGRR